MKMKGLAFALMCLVVFLLTGCIGDTSQSQIAGLADERSALEGQVHDFKKEVEKLEAENHDLEIRLHDAEAPYESPANEAILSDSEWRQGLLGLKQYVRGGRLAPGRLDEALNDMVLDYDIYWSPLEHLQFKRRYKSVGSPYGP